MDLEPLLRAARDREPGAWAAVVPRLLHELRWYFAREFDGLDAVELAQRTVTIVARQLPGFVPQKSLKQWVFGIARNQGRIELRAHGRDDRLRGLVAQVVRTPGTSPTARVYTNELLALLRAAIEQLPGKYRRVVEHDLEGGDIESFAEREGIKRSTARSHRFRAYAILRRQLVAHLESPPATPADHDSTPNSPT